MIVELNQHLCDPVSSEIEHPTFVNLCSFEPLFTNVEFIVALFYLFALHCGGIFQVTLLTLIAQILLGNEMSKFYLKFNLYFKTYRSL